MNTKKVLNLILPVTIALAIPVTSVFAHVVVKPNSVGIGAYQTFVTGVPNEKESPVTGLKLMIPSGVKSVTPNVKSGWTIEVKKEGTGDSAVVTEVEWTGGSIPVGQRDEFAFSAQAPASPTDLQWKAYQTYQDGTVVSWDQGPTESKEDNDSGSSGPYSITHVVNDIATPTSMPSEDSMKPKEQVPLILSIASLLLSGGALYKAGKK